MELWWLRISLVVFIERKPECKIFRNKIVLFIGTIGKVPWNENEKMVWGFLRYITVENILWPLWTSNQWFPSISFHVWMVYLSLFPPSLSVKWKAGWSFRDKLFPPVGAATGLYLTGASVHEGAAEFPPSSLVFAVSVPHNSEGLLHPEVNHREKFWTSDREMSYLYDSFLCLPEQRWFLLP